MYSGRLELPDNPTLRHTYSHDVLTEPALKFLQDSKNTPFFLYAAYTLPHFSSEDEDPDGLAVPSTDPRARCSTGQVASGRTRLSLLGLWSLSSTLRPGGAARRLERHPSGKEQRCDRASRFRNRYRRIAQPGRRPPQHDQENVADNGQRLHAQPAVSDRRSLSR